MESHTNTTNVLISYLKSHGYPESSIALEWGSNKSEVDIAILSEDLITPTSIFEIKENKNINSISFGIRQLKQFTNNIKIPVKCYLVFPKDISPFFEVYDITDYVYKNEIFTFDNFFDNHQQKELIYYNNSILGTSNKITKLKQEKKQKYVDGLKLVCWVLITPAIIAILVLERIGIYPFTTERLIVLGALIIITIIPFFSEINIKDLSLKHYSAVTTQEKRDEK